jgi:dTMP kinase
MSVPDARPPVRVAARLIAFEGIDGTGKSTLARRLAARLRDAGLEVVETSEPSQSSAGMKLREIFAQRDRTTTGEEELALFHEDRAEHVQKVVRPALARGAWVVQDRTFWSTAAYQGARGVPVVEILARSLRIAPKPDVTLLLTLAPDRALARITQGRERATSFEKLEDLRQVAGVYAGLAAREPSIVTIDADRPVDQVEESVVSECRLRLGQPP